MATPAERSYTSEIKPRFHSYNNHYIVTTTILIIIMIKVSDSFIHGVRV